MIIYTAPTKQSKVTVLLWVKVSYILLVIKVYQIFDNAQLQVYIR